MKILFPIGSFPPAKTAGAGEFLYSTTKALNKTGKTENYIISTDTNLSACVKRNVWTKNECGNVIFCKIYIHYVAVSMIIQSIRTLRIVDIVHLNGLFYPPSLIISFFAFLMDKKIIWSVHGSLYKEALSYSKIKKKFFLFLIRMIKRKVSFHATSASEAELIQEILPSKNNILNIPIYIESGNLSNQEEFQRFPYFLFLGRIHEIKAIDKLIEAFSRSTIFRKSHFNFIIAGDSENTYGKSLKDKVIKEKLNGKILFYKDTRGLQKERLYKNAFFSFLVSESENFGMVVLESLKEGTPVITSKGTPWSMLENYKAGFWIDNDVNSLSNIINKCLELSDSNYNSFRENAFQMFTKLFDIDKNIDKWINEYENSLEPFL